MSDSDALTITCSFLTSGQNLLKQDFICGDNVFLLHLSVALCTGVLLVLQYVEFTPSRDLLYFLSVFHSHFFSLFKKLANNVTKWYFRLPVFFCMGGCSASHWFIASFWNQKKHLFWPAVYILPSFSFPITCSKIIQSIKINYSIEYF